MKNMMLITALVSLCACATTTTTLPNTTSPTHHQYDDLEVRCAQQTISKIYTHSEHYGKDIFVFHFKQSEAWDSYLGCILQAKQ